MTDETAPRELVLHGHRMSYRTAGEGSVIALIHGITSTSDTWRELLPLLAERHTVVAPDLLGHGDSAKPRGDYSLGAYATGLRDLLVALGHERANIVGHSLGGGVAMQFAYQFPERCERLVLISSGGLGREVHLLLRAASLPGSELVLPLIAAPKVLEAGAAVGAFLNRIGLRPSADLGEIARGYASLDNASSRLAFLHTLRAVIDPIGQRVSARDRLYLAQEVPSLIVWGERDPVIPAEHGRYAHAAMPGSRLEVLPQAGHFPHLDEPRTVARALEELVAHSKPADIRTGDLRERLLAGAGAG
ncbi:MAG TPA: alpha/beta fold hydrolase [Thermoleophilaceae bacterium]|nr:alpha/beta fold hydrolase [Thermoleophilaceae bacterium]